MKPSEIHIINTEVHSSYTTIPTTDKPKVVTHRWLFPRFSIRRILLLLQKYSGYVVPVLSIGSIIWLRQLEKFKESEISRQERFVRMLEFNSNAPTYPFTLFLFLYPNFDPLVKTISDIIYPYPITELALYGLISFIPMLYDVSVTTMIKKSIQDLAIPEVARSLLTVSCGITALGFWMMFVTSYIIMLWTFDMDLICSYGKSLCGWFCVTPCLFEIFHYIFIRRFRMYSFYYEFLKSSINDETNNGLLISLIETHVWSTAISGILLVFWISSSLLAGQDYTLSESSNGSITFQSLTFYSLFLIHYFYKYLVNKYSDFVLD